MVNDKVKIIDLTDAACKHLRSLIEIHAGYAQFRLSVKKTGCSGYMYQPEIVQAPKQGDLLLKTNGLMVLIDSQCIPLVKGTVIDYIKKDFGQYQLRFINPNAIGSCGCGESFHLKKNKNKNEGTNDNEK
ncbi:iron-sulfur cluster assembly accessory protein [Coxiella endosymbiont of Amblyomma americanum]|uniref:iron-sulfur cluster assembly accessory protein n=1 Tax=Coxiella endosymbiont of Amblyomma americanum TaxID=325775 RepID=UPI000581EC76|nr:iron-sulfur cluster assembly accessory protein [Coxiella endosymbiont of Amblyomma americanum]AJC50529.1 FeS assembly scaffold SufA [Coxiella endosymbiont of Amblyomma americanum]